MEYYKFKEEIVMAYNNNQTTSKFNQNHNAVSTNGIMMFSGDMSLKLSFLDDAISIAFIPAVINEDGSRRFPKENRVYAILKLEAVVAFLRKMDSFFIPKSVEMYEEYLKDPNANIPPIEMGVPTNAQYTTMVTLYFDKPKDGAYVPQLRLHTDIDENRIPKKTMTYDFGVRPVFNKYDPATGEFELSKDQVQFYLFYETLWEFVKSATNASAHADRVVNSYTAKEQRNLVRQIAQKNGIAVFNNEYGNGNAFENNQSTQTTARQETRNEQPIESLFDPAGGSDDLPF